MNPYRYGFNGKENDNEIKGEGNQQDYGMRIYDPRIGKFLSVDPITKDYPYYTPYQFAGNSPIAFTDLDGLERRYYVFDFDHSAGKPVLTKIHTQTREPNAWNEASDAIRYARNRHVPYERRTQYNGDLIVDCSDIYVLHAGVLFKEFSNKQELLNTSSEKVAALSAEASHQQAMYLAIAQASIEDLRTSSNIEEGDGEIEASSPPISKGGEQARNSGKRNEGITAKDVTPQRDPKLFKTLNTSVVDGKITVPGKGPVRGEFDFVVTMDNQLKIGYGHFNLSGEALTVKAAGGMSIKAGQVKLITNSSGHYQPTVGQGFGSVGVLNNLGVNTQGAWLKFMNANGVQQVAVHPKR